MASSGDVGRANASAESSQNDGYDPLKDPRRRPKSSDPGWKYAYYVEPGKRDLIQCALCPRKIKGGIIRVKQHLAGGSTEILVCPKTTPDRMDGQIGGISMAAPSCQMDGQIGGVAS